MIIRCIFNSINSTISIIWININYINYLEGEDTDLNVLDENNFIENNNNIEEECLKVFFERIIENNILSNFLKDFIIFIKKSYIKKEI